MKIDNHIETIKNIILKSFYFLESNLFYSPMQNILENKNFDEDLEINYTNQIHRREISISYTKGKVYDDVVFTFSLTITRLPYSGMADIFVFSKYLHSIGIDLSSRIINHFDKNEAEIILNRIANELKDHALEIISGNIWLETFYPLKD